jgi:hypothetical protein
MILCWTIGLWDVPKLDFIRNTWAKQCFSLTSIQHQLLVISQPIIFFSHNKSAPATSQPNEAMVRVDRLQHTVKALFGVRHTTP